MSIGLFGTFPQQAERGLRFLEDIRNQLARLVEFQTPRQESEQEIIPIMPVAARGIGAGFPYAARAFALIVSADTSGLYGFSYGQSGATEKFQFHLLAFQVQTILLGPKGMPIARNSFPQVNQVAESAAVVVAALVVTPQVQ